MIYVGSKLIVSNILHTKTQNYKLFIKSGLLYLPAINTFVTDA